MPEDTLINRRYLALSAMIYAGAAVAWIVVAVVVGDVRNLLLIGLGLILTVLLIGAANSSLRHDEADAEDDGEDITRPFRMIFIVAVAAIAVGGGLLAVVGLAQWIVPWASLVVGLHFIPLARLLVFPFDFVVGAAFVVLVMFILFGVRMEFWVRPLALGMAAMLWLAGWGRLWIARQADSDDWASRT